MAITRIGNIASTIPDDSIANEKLSDIVNFKNIIINGDMSIAQRGTSVTGSTGGGYLTCDRWNFNIGGAGTWTQTQSTDVPTGQGFPNSFKLDCTTADASLGSGDIMQVQQRIEGQNLQYLKKGTANAKSLTCSFWVKSNKTGTYIVEFRERDNNRTISKSYTIDSANTWEKKILTFAGDTTGTINNDNGNSLQVNWWLAAGSNYSSGTLQTSWGTRVDANRAVGQVNLADSTSNDFYITGVQLEAGTSASDFEFLPYDVNLNRCERYFEKYERDATESHPLQCVAECDSAGRGECILYYKQKRTSPSITLTHTGAQWGRLNGGVNQYVTITGSITTAVGIGKKSAQIFATTGGTINTGEITFMRFTGTDKIEIDAEL